MADNRVIGKDGKLPWNNQEDLQNFKRLTSNGIVVMWRKTYESIGRPLPNRRNIILSSQELEVPGIEVRHSIPELLQVFQKDWIDKVFIIGGQKIYETFLDRGLVDEVYLSNIPGDYEGDTFLQAFEDDFIEVQSKQYETFRFVRYVKVIQSV